VSRSSASSPPWRPPTLPQDAACSRSCTGALSTSAAPATTPPMGPSGAPPAWPGTAPSSPGSGATVTLTTSSVRLCLRVRSVLTLPSPRSRLTSSPPPPSSSQTSPTSSLRRSQSRIFLSALLLSSLHVCLPLRHLRHLLDLLQLLWEQENCQQHWMSFSFSLGPGDHLRGR